MQDGTEASLNVIFSVLKATNLLQALILLIVQLAGLPRGGDELQPNGVAAAALPVPLQ